MLEARDLAVRVTGGPPIIEDVDVELCAGRVLGLVGESGSGKTTTALALLGYTRPGTVLTSGTVTVGSETVVPGAARRARGRLIAYLSQNPSTALDPAMRVGSQVAEMARFHGVEGAEGAEGEERLIEAAFDRVKLPTDRAFRRRFPHQLSGGQQQRVAIAVALVCSPPVVVLDEPTTGLDVITKDGLIEELDALRRQSGTSIVYVTHDLGVIARVADEVAVMYGGRIVEQGPTKRLLRRPGHPYTLGLVESVPDTVARRRIVPMPGSPVAPGDRPPGCAFAPRCAQAVEQCRTAMPALSTVNDAEGWRVRCPEWRRTPAPVDRDAVPPSVARERVPVLHVERMVAGYDPKGRPAVDGMSFEVAAGECVAVVGESGSGKTTLARCIAGLHRPFAGRVLLEGAVLAPAARDRSVEHRRKMQIIFQNPYDSLNPRHRVVDIVSRPARFLGGMSDRAAAERARELLDLVRLRRGAADDLPGALSGGERQRVAIARALAAEPSLLLCDEITSALDVSVQAAVLDLLVDLGHQLDLALLLITHDFGVVAETANRVLVLDGGRICEEGAVAEIIDRPTSPYTRRLVDAALSFSVREA